MSVALADVPEKTTTLRIERPTARSTVRVLHVVPSLDSGGMERAVVRLLTGLCQRDDGIEAEPATAHGLCVLQKSESDLLTQCRSAIPVWVLDQEDATIRTGRRRMARPIGRVIDDFQPDLVHARTTATWFDTVMANRGRPDVKLLLSFHGRTSLDPLPWRRKLVNRWACRHADGVMAVSDEACTMMQQEWGVSADKLHTISNGVNTNRFYPRDCDGLMPVIETNEHSEKGPIVACVANYLPIKAIDRLIVAWRRVAMAHRTARLWLIGEGPLRGDLESLARQLRCSQSIVFLGQRTNVPELLRQADLFVLPSQSEACSNAVLEAMATGLPVIAFDIGGMNELIEPNRTGWLVPSENPDRLADAMATALSNRRACREIGQTARQYVLSHHSMDRWLDHYVWLYQQLAGDL